MLTSSCKGKGRSLQKWLRDLLLSLGKGLTDADIRSTGMGQPGSDLQLSTAALEQFNYEYECKNLARVAVYKFYEQAKARSSKEVVVVIKQNRSKPLVIVDAEHFFNLVRKANDNKE